MLTDAWFMYFIELVGWSKVWGWIRTVHWICWWGPSVLFQTKNVSNLKIHLLIKKKYPEKVLQSLMSCFKLTTTETNIDCGFEKNIARYFIDPNIRGPFLFVPLPRVTKGYFLPWSQDDSDEASNQDDRDENDYNDYEEGKPRLVDGYGQVRRATVTGPANAQILSLCTSIIMFAFMDRKWANGSLS